jgi:uncharacterized protein YndB with AHSA1/START domain
MAIAGTTEIARTPEEVFRYLDDLAKHGEWQDQIVSVKVETEGPTRVGSRATEVRKVPGGERGFTYEITEHDPPKLASFRVIDGPIRPYGTISVSPVGDGTRSRVEFQLDFEGHGAMKVLLPLVRMDAKRHVPNNLQKLKERLEAGA